MIKPLILIVPVVLSFTAQVNFVHAQATGEQGQVRKEIRAGNVRSLREIESQVLPRMTGSQYLGPEYDPTMMAYRLKFLRDGRVLFIDVDARSGAVLDKR